MKLDHPDDRPTYNKRGHSVHTEDTQSSHGSCDTTLASYGPLNNQNKTISERAKTAEALREKGEVEADLAESRREASKKDETIAQYKEKMASMAESYLGMIGYLKAKGMQEDDEMMIDLRRKLADAQLEEQAEQNPPSRSVKFANSPNQSNDTESEPPQSTNKASEEEEEEQTSEDEEEEDHNSEDEDEIYGAEEEDEDASQATAAPKEDEDEAETPKEDEEEEEESEEEDAAETPATDDVSAESYTDRVSTRGGEPSRNEEEEEEEKETSGDDEVLYHGTTVNLLDRDDEEEDEEEEGSGNEGVSQATAVSLFDGDEAPTKKTSKASTKSFKSILMRNRFASSRPARNDFNTKVSQERLASEVNDKMEHRGGWHFESRGTGNAEANESSLQHRAILQEKARKYKSEALEEARKKREKKERKGKSDRKKEKKSKKKRDKKEKKGKRRQNPDWSKKREKGAKGSRPNSKRDGDPPAA